MVNRFLQSLLGNTLDTIKQQAIDVIGADGSGFLLSEDDYVKPQ
jgi:hypothetical protein